MRRTVFDLVLTVVVPAVVAVSMVLPATLAAETVAESKPVTIVELFTSQGCSSCPPADRLLGRLAETGDAFPLSFHVDYWNDIGWTDPFSSAAWSERQRRYARAFGTSRVYTPQLVIAGVEDCVGSQESCVRDALRRAAAKPAAGRVTLEVMPGDVPGTLRVEVAASIIAGLTEEADGTAGAPWDVLVALVEKDLVTPVGRGENSGRTLENDHVVRIFERAGSMPVAAGERWSGALELTLDATWRRDRLVLVAFLQDPRSMRIFAASPGVRISSSAD